MYPNPQDVLPLPRRPNLEHYRKRAKDLARACRSGDRAIDAWAQEWVENGLAVATSEIPDSERRGAMGRARQIAEFARERLRARDCSLSQAQLVVARAHGFASWPKLVHHIQELSGRDSDLSAFERSADAIVDGDLLSLERSLAEHPELVRQRSSRAHSCLLLHYVSANGVENYRQKTPPNIVPIASLLLDLGADVNAEADVYGGGATTLGLVVTSAHPRRAGVQEELADLLLERGARIDATIVRSCLLNGCPEAAVYMAARGAPLDLEAAAGIGRLDVVAQQFELPREPSFLESANALMLAAWYDKRDVVSFLLDHGVDVRTRSPRDGQTALHIAAYNGSPRLVEMLLKRGAPFDVIDDTYGTPPLVWALHAWLVERRSDAEGYRSVLRLLASAGAEVKSEWIDDDRLRTDRDLYAALSARIAEI